MLKRLSDRREKLFGEGRPVPMDRNAKVRLMTLARALMRRTERGRAYGAITAKGLAVLEALLWSFHNAGSGLCFPGYARIAETAGCAASTVGEAIRMLERAGLLTWVNRLARIRVYEQGLGWRKRVIRTSNAYAFADPQGASVPADRDVSRPVRPHRSSKTDLPSRTTTQDHPSTDAARRRDPDTADSPLDAALARLRGALHRGGTTIG